MGIEHPSVRFIVLKRSGPWHTTGGTWRFNFGVFKVSCFFYPDLVSLVDGFECVGFYWLWNE
jgi:hypothetical protein